QLQQLRQQQVLQQLRLLHRIACPLTILMMAVAVGPLRLKSDDVMTKDDTVGRLSRQSSFSLGSPFRRTMNHSYTETGQICVVRQEPFFVICS
ncbi:MAG: hypothetical protein ACPG7P_09200, partial [Candidatus Puniceispirillaceae bacterium]